MNELRHATSPLLQQLLLEMDRGPRAILVSALEEFRTALIDEHKEKDAYLFHAPIAAIGVFHCTRGGCVRRGKELLQKCIDEVATAIAEGKGDKIDRLARKWFVEGAPVREASMQFIAEENPNLEDYPLLFIAIQEYELSPFVGRRIEKVHALIKRAGSFAPSAPVPQLCAIIREKRNLDDLKRNADFFDMALAKWNQRTLVDQVLLLRCDKEVLQKMKFHEKLDMIYQCSLAEEYQSADASHVAHLDFQVMTSHTRSSPTSLSANDKLCIDYLRAMFANGEYFSMDEELLQAATTEFNSDSTAGNGVEVALALASAVSTGTVTNGINGAFFRIITNDVEQRKVKHVAHIERKTTLMSATLMTITGSWPGPRYGVYADQKNLMTLDLRIWGVPDEKNLDNDEAVEKMRRLFHAISDRPSLRHIWSPQLP